MSVPCIEVRDLRFDFGDDGFSLWVPELEIKRGATHACIGPSGSGKSTLLQLMAGILLPKKGTVALDGVVWSELSDADRRRRRIGEIGLVFQEFELLEHLTVRENILLPYLIQRSLELDDAARERAAELAAAAGIEGMLRRPPRALSQGERQRVALCRALVTRPAVVLADEPTGNLDPRTTESVLDLLLAQVRERAATLVMVTHDHSLVPRFDAVIEVRAGAEAATVAPRAGAR